MCDAGKVEKVVGGYQNYEEMTGALDSEFQQNGGGTGYLLDLEQPRIGGQSQVTGYVAQPEYSDGSLVGQRTADGRLMGTADQCGGAKKKLYGKKNNNNNNKAVMNNNFANVNNNNKMVNNVNINNKSKRKHSNSKRTMKKGRHANKKRYSHKKGMRFSKKKGKGGKNKRHFKGKYHRKYRSKNRNYRSKNKRNKNHKKMTGGGEEVANNANVAKDCGYEVQGEGQNSVYHDNMGERTFDGKQPNWEPGNL